LLELYFIVLKNSHLYHDLPLPAIRLRQLAYRHAVVTIIADDASSLSRVEAPIAPSPIDRDYRVS